MSQKTTYKLVHCFFEKEDYLKEQLLLDVPVVTITFTPTYTMVIGIRSFIHSIVHGFFAKHLIKMPSRKTSHALWFILQCRYNITLQQRFQGLLYSIPKKAVLTHIYTVFLYLWWLRNKRSMSYRCRWITCEHLLQHVSHWRTTQHLWEKQLLDNRWLNFSQGW